jgi:hypothetical protein
LQLWLDDLVPPKQSSRMGRRRARAPRVSAHMPDGFIKEIYKKRGELESDTDKPVF